MNKHHDLLDSNEYTEAIAQGRKGFAQSAIILAIAVVLFGMVVVLAVGTPKLEEPDFIELVTSGIEVLQGIVPDEGVVPIVGVLATVCIAHAVSIRSTPAEVRRLQEISTSDRGKLKDAVRRASQLQSSLLASTMFSVLGAALAALVTVIVALNGDGAAAAVSGFLALFLFFELVRLQQATSELDEFKKSVSSKDRASFHRAFAAADGHDWRSIVWYSVYLLTIVVPAVVAAEEGFLKMAVKIAVVSVITWSFGLSAAIAYVRGSVGVSVSSRLAARLLSVVLFFVVWMMTVQIAIEYMSDASVSSWALVNTYFVAFVVTLLWAFLRIWGESGWLFFRWFGAQHSAIVRTAGEVSLDGLSWANRPKNVMWKAFACGCAIVAPPVGFAIAASPESIAWYPLILIILSMTIAATARWSVAIERAGKFTVAILIVIATGWRGVETVDADDVLAIVTLVASMTVTAGVVIAMVWDRRRRFVLMRPMLTILDLDFARRFRQDIAELGYPSLGVRQSPLRQGTRLLSTRSSVSEDTD
ncbi:hypothetical protein [Brevibacterium sp. UCMA 11754]|uniref:hypothetical protein n=1 Tax=Brevibacterium sp. UCMA 11754 TaxID=2749198 RepID=UPI001F1DCB1E|nr:hypothetical protein [Brevibacterium sp. UCMA 11754]MCF2571152.1 hypothetical protein [Brevibacterium sp. UCMA 11754]